MKKKATSEQHTEDSTDMRPEYDFTGGVRGKHHQSYSKGHVVRVRKADGTATVRYFTLKEGAVMLDPDVRMYFPNSEAVNEALRSLLEKKRHSQH